MKQLFRDQLANEELVTWLLETADDTGVFSDRATYGRGKLGLAAATQPVGILEVPVGPDVAQAGYDLGTTHLGLGVPFGNGPGLSVSSHEMMALPAPTGDHLRSCGSTGATARPASQRARAAHAVRDHPRGAPARTPATGTRLRR